MSKWKKIILKWDIEKPIRSYLYGFFPSTNWDWLNWDWITGRHTEQCCSIKDAVCTVLPGMLTLPAWTVKLISQFSLPDLISYCIPVFHIDQYTHNTLKLFILKVWTRSNCKSLIFICFILLQIFRLHVIKNLIVCTSFWSFTQCMYVGLYISTVLHQY